MNMFRDGLNSIPIQNDHYDEILEISDDESEDTSMASAIGDLSPSKVSQCTLRNGAIFQKSFESFD
jgi:hypothetical protein